jgi:ubiquinone/menaquinone biosynthesis C-methylase UbiE
MTKINEIEYINNISVEWKESAFNKPYSENLCGRYLIDMGSIINILPPPPGKLLDLGIGTGWTSIFFAKRGYKVTGQDIAEDMLELAQKNKIRNGIENLDFITCDYESLPFKEEYDYAIFYDCLHHCLDLEATLKGVFKALKPGGICIAVEPGSGHSKTKDSIIAMKLWGVTERDMPPSLIIRVGYKIGFNDSKVYLRMQDAPFETLSNISWQGFIKACKTFLRFLPIISRSKSNITVLIKPK